MIIYIAINNTNNKCYVGQTTKSLDIRKYEHFKQARQKKRDSAFMKALRKYGEDGFTWLEVEACATVDQLNEREQHFIEYFRSLVPYGYNLDAGGRNRIVHPDTCRKVSESKRGKVPFRPGYRHSEETKRKISLGNTGKVRPPVSAETRARQSAALKGLKRPYKAQPNRRKPVALINKYTGEIVNFDSIKEAAAALGVRRSNLGKVVQGLPNFRSAGGWITYKGESK